MKRFLFPAAVLIALLASPALASYDGAFPYAPDPNYTDPGPITFGAAFVRDIRYVRHFKATALSTTPGSSSSIPSFFDVFCDISLDGGASWTPRTGAASCTIGEVCDDGNDFSTEMTDLDLTFDPPPPGESSPPITLRESPTKQSLGKLSATPNGDGTFHITSFFDVFTELSLDGGASWTPADSSAHFDATAPEPASLALLSLSLPLLLRRRKS